MDICGDGRPFIYFLHIHKTGGTAYCHLAHVAGRLNAQPQANCNPWRAVRSCRQTDIILKERRWSVCRHEVAPGSPADDVGIQHLSCSRSHGPDPKNVWLRTSTNPHAVRCRYMRHTRGRAVEEVPLWSMNAAEQLAYFRANACGREAGGVGNERFLPKELLPTMLHSATIRYIVVLRHPIGRLISQWRHESGYDVDLPPRVNFTTYVLNYAWDNFAVRSICGERCVESEHLVTREDQQLAEARLASFHVHILELINHDVINASIAAFVPSPARMGEVRKVASEMVRRREAAWMRPRLFAHVTMRRKHPVLWADLQARDKFDISLFHGAVERMCSRLEGSSRTQCNYFLQGI